MNRKSVFLTFLVSLMALVVISSLSSPVAAVAEQVEAAPVKNADYWFDRGALCATYGNDPAAIKFFQKAITLDPQRSGAYFTQGISYGQLDEFDKALGLIDRAIAMEPQNGLFIYGRGRVHLLAGNKQKAMADFRQAAELDDEDAQTYLDWIGPER
jgi:tetratricopeptide (TPR) repeat protein